MKVCALSIVENVARGVLDRHASQGQKSLTRKISEFIYTLAFFYSWNTQWGVGFRQPDGRSKPRAVKKPHGRAARRGHPQQPHPG